MIPRILHTVWVGPKPAPEETFAKWRAMNPSWELRVYRDAHLEGQTWRNAKWLKHWHGLEEWCGIADIMRWELLEQHGGFAIDADAPPLAPLEDWTFNVTAFACWENERARPGLISNAFVACQPGDKLVADINRSLEISEPVPGYRAWQLTGPLRLTAAWRTSGFAWTIWPSHLFMPTHFGLSPQHQYAGIGPSFARQLWGSTVQ